MRTKECCLDNEILSDCHTNIEDLRIAKSSKKERLQKGEYERFRERLANRR